jgi:hypothetical protein
MLRGRYGPHTPEIQRKLRLCNVDYKGLACCNRRCIYLYADPKHSMAQSDELAI